MIFAEHRKTDKYKKIVISKDWENLSSTSKAKAGATGYVTSEHKGHIAVLFSETSKDKVTSSDPAMLICYGIPLANVRFL